MDEHPSGPEEGAPAVSGYRVVRRLGEDALSRWYEAELRGRVHLRVLRPGLADDQAALDMFHADTERAAGLRHATALGVVVAGGMHAAVGAAGRTLADELATGWPLGEVIALAYARDLAAAAACIDARDLAHRNVTPSAVHLGAGGEARLAVLGDLVPRKVLAAQRGRLTQDPRYAAPELITGNAPIDGRSATYVLGGVLFHMLAGSPPHPASSPLAMARAHLRDDFPRIGEVRSDLTAGVADLCVACTEREPLLRPPPEKLVVLLAALHARAARRTPHLQRRAP